MKEIKINKTNETLYYEKLNNGLEVYIVPNKFQKNFYITFTTKFGSINTEFKTSNDKTFKKVPNGIAHYLEHLMFNMEDGTGLKDIYYSLKKSKTRYRLSLEQSFQGVFQRNI